MTLYSHPEPVTLRNASSYCNLKRHLTLTLAQKHEDNDWLEATKKEKGFCCLQFRAKKTRSFVGSKWWLSRTFLLLLLLRHRKLGRPIQPSSFSFSQNSVFSSMSKDALPYSCACQAFSRMSGDMKERNISFSSNRLDVFW